LILNLIQTAPAANPVANQLFLFALIAGIFYIIVFLPEQRRRKQHQLMLNGLQNGTTIVTVGGVIGTVEKIQDNVLTLRVRPDGVKMQVTRASVASLFEEGK
jgi:preprotein translocase subunit YajC